MKIDRISGTFGRLQQDTLELHEGLNIIHSPNEGGKSTWSALLTAILYGISSRERDRAGVIAEKNRYAPWTGAAMSGRLDCRHQGNAITLLRVTRRANAPMAEFGAFHAGTREPVPDLTGLNCGEYLTGVSREVWERSAFIRQSGLAVSQDAELERRIATLLSSGEETTSYTEALAALKKQLHLRRHNKTGQLPALESRIALLEQQLSDAHRLADDLARSQEQVCLLTARLQELTQQQAVQTQAAACHSLEEADAALAEATERTQRMAARVQAQHIPDTAAIGRLRGAIVNLATARKSVDKARADRDEALKQLLRAETALSESPFSGQTPEQATREITAPPKGKADPLPAILVALLLLAAAAGAAWSLQQPLILVAGAAAAPFVCIPLVLHSRKKAGQAALVRRFGTADPAAIRSLLDTYINLYAHRDAAQAEADRAAAQADALADSFTSNEQTILLEVRRFAPAAFDLSAADSALRSAYTVHKTLEDARSAQREAQLQRDLLARQLEQGLPAGKASPQLDQFRIQLDQARSTADRIQGQLQAMGDPAQLREELGQLTARRDALEQEYASLALAIDTLTRANTALQSRFSPALGRRTAEIFAQLTGGRYTSVTLDRGFHLAAEPAGDPILRDAGLLSAGATDQLYLALRLAICDLVLPGSDPAPILLDDALVNFDDERCAVALTYLKELARRRQILLFTCHRREADHFQNDPEVFVQSLVDEPKKEV